MVPVNRTYKGKPDNIFYIVFWQEGKQVWEKIGSLSEGYSAKTAAGLRGDRIRDLRHGEELPQRKKKAPRFRDVVAQYLAWAVENKTRSGKDDLNRYENHLTRFDDKRLNEISSFDLEKLKSDLQKEGLAPGTVRHCLVLVRQMFNKAKAWGIYAGENPITGVKLPVPMNQRSRFLSREEADLLITELRKTSEIVADMAVVSLHSGLRAGEIFALRGHDLDFTSGLINVADPKNKHPRKAFMTGPVREILQQRSPKTPADLVFRDRVHGGKSPLSPKPLGRPSRP